ncbi:hypothetical protein G4B88_010102 [Cannabis sativa]|uniref:RNase H type-1 domain-containing protein n=1 Tax=Cannabis sativa TaxID=3483 RepID=A0A7J6GJ82_CANSA|nr:hypothetical protein G4B88_010102 [Cannabis sativa]
MKALPQRNHKNIGARWLRIRGWSPAAAASSGTAGPGMHGSATINGRTFSAARSENQGNMAENGGGDQSINVARMGGAIGGDRAVFLESQQNNNGCWSLSHVPTVATAAMTFAAWFEAGLRAWTVSEKLEASMIVWAIWKHRNELVWNSKRPEVLFIPSGNSGMIFSTTRSAVFSKGETLSPAIGPSDTGSEQLLRHHSWFQQSFPPAFFSQDIAFEALDIPHSRLDDLYFGRRGRPLKEAASLSAKPICLKKEGKRRISKKDRKHYSDPWNASAVELAIDLDNHFVIIDKNPNSTSNCVISEILENEDPQQQPTKDATITNEKTIAQIISWNYRGLGNKVAVRQLTALIRQSNPEVIIISETRLSLDKFHSLCGKLHFVDGVYVPPVGRAGGIGLYWKRGVRCEDAHGDKNLISVVIESDPPGNPWNLLGVYGPPVLAGKEVFWNRVSDLIINNSILTLLIGDLNGTLVDHETLHYSNRGNATKYSFDLRRMVSRTGVIDLGAHGGKFTWFQKTSGTGSGCTLKRARLDQALAFVNWRMLHPNAIVRVLSAATSDHRPILLDTKGGANVRKSQFKYELMWARDPKCFWVVKNAWKDQLHHNPMLSNVSCPIFGEGMETAFHLLWECSLANALWFNSGLGMRVDRIDVHEWQHWCTWFKTWHNRPPNVSFEDILIVGLCIVETMWKERNSIIHGGDRSIVRDLILHLNRRISEHRLVATGDVEEVCVWTPPPVSWMCCNCDVAMSKVGSVIATVARDEKGSILTIKAENLLVSDPKVAEAHAVCMAADLSVERKMGKVIFQSDNLRVVNAFSAEFEVS